jgi:pimeloyl-ACP methyl ester carboxylesterase
MRVLELAAVTVEFSVLAFIVGIVVYALGSFLLMRPYTTARALGISLRELARETFLAGITQPFLPVFYLLGRRMEPFFVRPLPKGKAGQDFAGRVPVVFVHGYMQNRVGFLGLAYALARRNIGPLYGFNYPWFDSIVSNAKRLEQFIDRVCEETGSQAVDLVCHSMGGLVAMEMMRDEAWATTSKEDKRLKVRRCVTIATPHAGVMWRGPIIGIGAASLRRGSKLLEAHSGFTLTVPTLSVFSSHDNVVHPKETSQLVKRGGRDIEIEGVGHLSILFSGDVADHVASFLVDETIPNGSDVPLLAPGPAGSAPAAAKRDDVGLPRVTSGALVGASETIVGAEKEPDVRGNNPSGGDLGQRPAPRRASYERRKRCEDGCGGA